METKSSESLSESTISAKAENPSVFKIPGLIYVDNFIMPDNQKQFVNFIDKQEWNTSISRRTQHYGYVYSYNNSSITPTTPIPEIFHPLLETLRPYFKVLPDQLIVNEYYPGQGIAPHTDHVGNFGSVVASISLLAPIEMTFSANYNSTRSESIILRPCSAVILTGDARYKWKHSIAGRKFDMIDGQKVMRSRRISLTFRTIKTIFNNNKK